MDDISGGRGGDLTKDSARVFFVSYLSVSVYGGYILYENMNIYSATTRTMTTQTKFDTFFNQPIRCRVGNNQIGTNFTWPSMPFRIHFRSFASFIHSFNGKRHSAADSATVLAPFYESRVMSRLFL